MIHAIQELTGQTLTGADTHARELVAAKVIALAGGDERNANKVRDPVLREYMTKNSVV
jgi:hypothetical protein